MAAAHRAARFCWVRGHSVVFEVEADVSALDNAALRELLDEGPFPRYFLELRSQKSRSASVEVGSALLDGSLQASVDFKNGRTYMLKDTALRDSASDYFTLQNIALVAVLIANVAYLGYLTPPGGSTPYWLSCRYDTFVAFVVCNALAFTFAVLSVLTIVFGSWLSHTEKGRLRASRRAVTGDEWMWQKTVRQTSSALLLLSIISFSTAFFVAGLVVAGLNTPPLDCGLLKCTQGGFRCANFRVEVAAYSESNVTYILDPNVGILNGFLNASSNGVNCFLFSRITNETSTGKIRVVGLASVDPRELEVNSTRQQMVICGPYPIDIRLDIPTVSLALDLAGRQSLPADSFFDIVRPELLPLQTWKDGYDTYSNLAYFCSDSVGGGARTLCERTSSLAVSRTGDYVSKQDVSTYGGVYRRSEPIAQVFWITVVCMLAFQFALGIIGLYLVRELT